MTAPPAELEGASASLVSAYSVKLSVFEGPLDLLLHLIRINEVEITDIPISRIAEQYLEYLGLLHELDTDVAGEYLVMAATLAWIKSRMLLPAETTDEDGDEIDPRAELVARLLEYQRFKLSAGELGERQLLGRDVFDAQAAEIEPEAEREIEVGLFELMEAFRRAVKRRGPAGLPHEVEAERITVVERMHVVMEAIDRRERIEFDRVFAEVDECEPTRPVFVATFLAILELTRLEALHLYQGANEIAAPSGPIHLRRVAESGAGSWRERIADLM